MKTVTSVTVWNDAVGSRVSITYSEVDEKTGKVTSDNNRLDRVILDDDAKAAMEKLFAYAKESVDDTQEA